MSSVQTHSFGGFMSVSASLLVSFRAISSSPHIRVKHGSKLKKPEHPPPGVTAHGLRVNGWVISFHRKEVGPQRWAPGPPNPQPLLLPSSLPRSPTLSLRLQLLKKGGKKLKTNQTSVTTPCEPSTLGFSTALQIRPVHSPLCRDETQLPPKIGNRFPCSTGCLLGTQPGCIKNTPPAVRPFTASSTWKTCMAQNHGYRFIHSLLTAWKCAFTGATPW